MWDGEAETAIELCSEEVDDESAAAMLDEAMQVFYRRRFHRFKEKISPSVASIRDDQPSSYSGINQALCRSIKKLLAYTKTSITVSIVPPESSDG